MSEIHELLQELAALNASDVGPFPYAGCREMQAADAATFATIIPDLDSYLSELAGYRSWGKRILTWADEKIEDVERRLHTSFFDRYPRYANAKLPADVSHALEIADRSRMLLAEILRRLRVERITASQ